MIIETDGTAAQPLPRGDVNIFAAGSSSIVLADQFDIRYIRRNDVDITVLLCTYSVQSSSVCVHKCV